MPLPFDFEGKRRVLAESYCYYSSKNKEGCFLLGTTSSSCNSEPTSILDTIGSPSPPTSTSTLSSSFGGAGGGGGGGGGGSTDTAGVAAVSGNPSQKWPPVAHQENVGVESGCGSSDLHPPPLPLEVPGGSATAAVEKCGMGMEDWESMLSDSVAASPSQEQSFLRWIMGDVEDPSMGLNKLLQSGGGGGPAAADFEFNGGFGVVDQGFGLDPISSSSGGGVGVGNLMGLNINPCLPTAGFPTNKFNNNEKILGLSPNLPNYKLHNNTPMFSPLSNNLLPISLSQQCLESPPDVKPQIFNPQFLINQHQSQHTQIPAFFLPLSHTQQQQQQQDQQHLILPPQPKRHNPGGLEPVPKSPFSDSMLPPPQPHSHHQLQLLPHYLQQRPTMGMKPKIVADEIGHNNQHQQQQQVIIDQLFKAAELVQTGNSVLAQGILARLNHQLSPIGKPFHRAALFCKEALQLLLHTNNNNNPSAAAANSPYNLIFKIGAYKSFSEISPLLQFANFTCNQALLEVLDGFDRIHIIDFDIGYGGQWASLMQELALRNGGAPSLKITAFASPSTHDQLELGLTRENLMHFAGEINMGFEFEILSLETLHSASWSLPLHVSENEAIAVNLPVGSYSNYQLSLPSILRFVKQLSPKIVVSVDRGCDRTDLPFPNHVIHVLQSYSNLLESLDAVNVNLDALQKIERFLLQPGIEKIVMGRYRSPEKTPHWRTLFLSSGFSPLTFSNFTESQAECVIKRTPVRGFHVEKRQTSLVLCWQRKELISASAWRC